MSSTVFQVRFHTCCLDDFITLKSMEYSSDVAPKLLFSQKILTKLWNEQKVNLTMAMVIYKLADTTKDLKKCYNYNY